MNKKITEAFAKGKAFIPFVTGGDPSLDVTEKIVYAMEEAGADLIELGIPFSDPTAEGPVIQGANLRALSGGVTGMRSQITTDIGAMVELVKAQKDIPCAVGFGISTSEQAKKMAAQADGVIVGSAIVKLCETHGADCVPYIKEYVKSMKDAIR